MTRTASELADRQIERLLSAGPFRAVAQFGNRLGDVSILVDAHQALTGPGPGRRHEKVGALNRAILVLLASQFQGFVLDLFSEAWMIRYDSQPDAILRRVRLNNAIPEQDIDPLFSFLGVDAITEEAEARPGSSSAGPAVRDATPVFVRAGERSRHQCREVVTEMVRVRNNLSHGGKDVGVRLTDDIGYLTDCVTLALSMSRVLQQRGIRPAL